MTKSPSSVLEVLEALEIQVFSTGREIACHCPFHADRHPSFSINAETGLWICYQCGERGSLEILISKVGKGIEASTPKAYLREIRHRSVGRSRTSAPEPEPEEEEPLSAMVYARYESFRAPPRWAYEDRFISDEAIDRYGLKWDHGWVVPIWSPDLRGAPDDLWGWQFKRLSFVRNYPPGVRKAQTLFGLREFKSGRVVLVESPLDVARISSVGLEGGLATFGAMVSQAQLRLVLERAESVLVALDNDLEGRTQGRKVYRHLARYLPTEVLKYRSDAKDPGEMPDDELKECLEET